MPVITISRHFGAGGRTLGEHLASRLGYAVVDEDIIEQTAQKANVSPEWIKSLEQEAGGSLQRYFSGLKSVRESYLYKAAVGKQGYIDGHRYVELLYEIIPQLANRGNVIILGRGSQYILQNRPNTYHFLLVARHEDRIQFLSQNYDIDQNKAQQIVSRQDKIRTNLYRFFGKEDYNSPFLYHAVLNMSQLSQEQALKCSSALLDPDKETSTSVQDN
ncbi:MAG: cytidylate kinase-like family protein [Desulfohalobiaceae bacterium]